MRNTYNTSKEKNVCNMFDTSVSSPYLKIIILYLGLIGFEQSKQILSWFTFLRRVFTDSLSWLIMADVDYWTIVSLSSLSRHIKQIGYY